MEAKNETLKKDWTPTCRISWWPAEEASDE